MLEKRYTNVTIMIMIMSVGIIAKEMFPVSWQVVAPRYVQTSPVVTLLTCGIVHRYTFPTRCHHFGLRVMPETEITSAYSSNVVTLVVENIRHRTDLMMSENKGLA